MFWRRVAVDEDHKAKLEAARKKLREAKQRSEEVARERDFLRDFLDGDKAGD